MCGTRNPPAQKKKRKWENHDTVHIQGEEKQAEKENGKKFLRGSTMIII